MAVITSSSAGGSFPERMIARHPHIADGGLSAAEAQSRLATFGPNEIPRQ
ncbi:MAG: hypothetical protein DMF84_00155 [Acidobacteria bacterium]|nr:MAG: hypothetical protein DMF84_00155 [Acidobacteriota bacterium]